jgi:hypothetical protein
MKAVLAALVLAVGLGGCATHWVVDSDVRSFSNMASVPAGASYRFERLPSQQLDEAAQQQLEAMAGAALDGVGLRHDDSAAQLSALIGARVTSELSPWADPWMFGSPWPGWGGPGWGPRGWYGPGWYGGWYGPAFGPPPTPWFRREVSIVLRELPSNRVVYESHARNDGPYSNSAAVLPVMFQAALQDFPNPPPGERRVDIELPRKRDLP